MSGWDEGSRPFELAQGSGRQFAPATQRNREPIGAILDTVLPESGTVLEIASGTGEHAVCFAARFPHLLWQPTDMSDAAMASIAAWRAESGLPNLLAPLRLDLCAADWPVVTCDAMFCANMTHIAPWEATVGLFRGASAALEGEAPLVLYGPFLEEGVPTAPSNLAFDLNLKSRNAQWGLRDIADLENVAADAGLARCDRVAMPANNLILIYRRTSST